MEYRTYEIVLRHLSGVNKGVQAEHSAKRYIWKYRNEPLTEIVMENLENETTIMVDGGTHQDMVEIHNRFEDAGIHHTYFIEPDLNDCMTAITVIADERVWDRKNYKSYSEFVDLCMIEDGLNPLLSSIRPGYIEQWYEYIGGEKNSILMEILQNKKLSI